MFSYGTGGLHTLPLHLVRFLWLPALNVCSLIGDWFQSLVPIQSSPSDSHSRFYVAHCATQHQTSSCWRGVDTMILDPEDIV